MTDLLSQLEAATITTAQREILSHTKWRAAGRMYCGWKEDPDLVALCDAGLMEYLGTKAWLPETDGYFTITAAGIAIIKAHESKAEAA